MSTWTGKTFGNVIIGELIARGGMAEVYHGTHTTLDRPVAVKIMREHMEEDADSRERFAREARVIASLEHPNIIRVYDYDLVNGRPYLVMELVEGMSLATYIKELQKREKNLPYPVIVKFMQAIASAVDYAHERGIIHRDIKPANILLRSKSAPIRADAPLPEDVEPVLTDFGLVRLIDATVQTVTGAVSGTPSYMSPEQARGDRVDPKTDIYSLGIVLYEMLAGVVPFDAESSFGVLMKHLNEPPPPITRISASMQAVVNRALAKDPEDRFDTANQLVAEFIKSLDGKSISHETLKINNAIKINARRKSPARNRSLLVGGGVVILALLVALGFALTRPAPSAGIQGQPIGAAVFDDFNWLVDKISITTSGLPRPAADQHLQAWLLANGGETKLNIGPIIFTGQTGQLNFTNPSGENLFGEFDELMITVEPADDPDPNEPSSEIIASSVFPPLALMHVRHILYSVDNTPDQIALIQGLWDTADTIHESVSDLRELFVAGDEKTLRLRNEEIINQLVGDQNAELYKDWNGDGEINDPNDGFGLLENGTDRGYISQTASHDEYAMEAPDASSNIVQNGQNLKICLQNMQGWSENLLDLALQLQSMPYGADMEALISKMESVSASLLYGVDSNGNGRIEPIIGEGGADTAYYVSYALTQMPLYLGVKRMPRPVNTAQP